MLLYDTLDLNGVAPSRTRLERRTSTTLLLACGILRLRVRFAPNIQMIKADLSYVQVGVPRGVLFACRRALKVLCSASVRRCGLGQMRPVEVVAMDLTHEREP